MDSLPAEINARKPVRDVETQSSPADDCSSFLSRALCVAPIPVRLKIWKVRGNQRISDNAGYSRLLTPVPRQGMPSRVRAASASVSRIHGRVSVKIDEC